MYRAEDTARARNFYEQLFGWKYESWPGMDFYLISTTNLDGTPGVGGGLGKRMDPSQRMMNYFGVQSIDAAMGQVQKLAAKSSHRRWRCLQWATLPTALTPRGTPSGSGKRIRKRSERAGCRCLPSAGIYVVPRGQRPIRCSQADPARIPRDRIPLLLIGA